VNLQPKAGFDWMKVNWGGPEEPVSDDCSYCGDAIPEESVPLRLWNAEGWAAVFCDHCSAAWFGLQSFDGPDDDDEDA
jgi:hypothetical protein